MFEAWCNCKGTGLVPALAGDEVIYAICDFCDGAGVIQIKGEDMEEQEEKQPFAYEEYVELKKTYQEVRDKVWEQRAELNNIRDLVRNFFQEKYAENDYDDYFNVDVEDVNTLLSNINASELERVYEASATIELTIRVHAENKDDAESIIDDHLTSIDFGAYGGEDEYEVESIDVRVND